MASGLMSSEARNEASANLSREGTVESLLSERAEMFLEAVTIGERLNKIKKEIAALDRIIASAGYIGDLEIAMPRRGRAVMLGCSGRCFANP